MAQLPNATVVVGNTEFLSIIIPLSIFDKYEAELSPLFGESDPKAIENYRKVLDDMRELFADQLQEAGLEFFKGLMERWDLREEVINAATGDPEQIPEEDA